MKNKENTRVGKLLRPIGVGATGVAEVGAAGITMPAIALGSSRTSMAAKDDMQGNQRVESINDRKKRRRIIAKDKRYIPIALVSCTLPSLFALESKTLFFMTSSSLEFSRTSSDPSSEEKFESSPWVAELEIDEGVTKEKLSFTA